MSNALIDRITEGQRTLNADSPAACAAELGLVYDALSMMSAPYSEAAGQLARYDREKKKRRAVIFAGLPKERSVAAKERTVENKLVHAGDGFYSGLRDAEERYARWDRAYQVLNTQRSILQTLMRSHEQDHHPTQGQGA